MKPRPLTRRQLLLGALGLSAGGLSGCKPRAPQSSSTLAASDARTAFFRDVTAEAGLHFQQGHNGNIRLNILDTIGSGCAFLDYDNDGWLDILLVGQPSCALYQNQRNGAFKDVTRAAGLGAEGHWLGCAVGDFNNDGYPDLYVSGYNCGALYLNDGSGSFKDVTHQFGINPERWETSCGFLDANGDGLLDLYVARYVQFGRQNQQFCTKSGVTTACGPLLYKPDRGTLYLNKGHQFIDATAQSGLKLQAGNGLGVAFADYDGSHQQSIALANDEMPGNLFHNLGGGKFKDMALDAGTALSARGATYGGMGLDWGDYNNDGRLDLVIGTFHNEPAAVFHNYGSGLFIDESEKTGLSSPTTPWVNFGLRFFDFNNDGHLDLIITNGHVQAGLDRVDSSMTYKQPLQLFQNDGHGQFAKCGASISGSPFAQQYVGRGLAVGDFDHDGGLDVLFIDSEGSVVLLHNEVADRGNWLCIDLEGHQGPRSGEGAIIRLQANGKNLMRNVTTSGSYLSANPIRVHFGLASAASATNIKIEWPRGPVQTIQSLEANHTWMILEGQAPTLRGSRQ